MTISIYEALNDYRYIYFGFQSHPTDKNPWQATPIMAVSDNLVQWNAVSTFKDIEGLRDGFVKKIGDYYYIIGTDAFYKTTDFMSFEPLPFLDTSKYKNLWAPEIFKDTQGEYHIVYCAGDAEKGILDVYLADFDPKTDTINNQGQEVSFIDSAIDNSYKIDPDICLIDGVYYLTIGGNYVLSSNNYLGPYQGFPTNFSATPQKFGMRDSGISGWVEGPNMFVDGDSVRLFSDQTDGNGLIFRSATKNDMFNWSNTENTHSSFKMRHGCIFVNDSVSAQVDVEFDLAPKFDERMTISGIHSDMEVPLTCYLRNSLQVQYEDNQTNQIQFVAFDDGSPSFALIANESTVTFNSNLYIIKNVEEDDQGIGLYTVTAIQYVNSEIGRVRQRNIRSGTLTYTINDVLDFFLNDKTANPFGFSYCVYGEFDKEQIENLGNMSGKDMISKIIETWPGTIIYPNGKRLDVFAANSFKRDYDRRIVYIHDTSNIKMIEDSTVISNQVMCIGATKDSEISATDSGSGLSQTITQQVIDSGADHTADFQADAKKYLGVPYVWGGHNKANPWAGMDCSGYVSQVYHDFGIEIPVYTVSMEHNFREIPYSEVKPGDVGFYGPHGGTNHICLMLDHNTMIYEPEPGESCKTAPVSSYAPSWYGRNDQMQAKINTKKEEVVDNLHLHYSDDYSSSTSTDTNQQYYFQPFLLTDENSKNNWGLHPGADIQDDRFKDPDAMKKYAMKQLVPDPAITVEIVMDDNQMPIPGEVRSLTIPNQKVIAGDGDTQSSFTTSVTVVGYTWYPFNENQGTDITFNNLQASILHAKNTTSSELKRIEQLANAALDRMPQVFYSNEDPSANQVVKNGAIWTKPISFNEEGGDNSGNSNNSSTIRSGSTTNKAT